MTFLFDIEDSCELPGYYLSGTSDIRRLGSFSSLDKAKSKCITGKHVL